MVYTIDWVVKASKLCNLRCKYCYEWDELADPERMSFSLWAKVLTAIREHLEEALSWDFHGGAVQSDIIWHGGEPLLLPDSYLKGVLALQREIFPAEWLESGRVKNVLQTNLYKVSDARLRLLREAGFSFGVSYDGVQGTRLTAGGKASEPRVLANIERARKAGFDPGIIVVLGGHTAPHLVDLYEDMKGRVRDMKLLPLFAGPDSRDVDAIEVPSDRLVEAMTGLFEHWLDDGCAMPVDPLDRYFTAVLNTRLGLSVRPYDRRRYGDTVLVVNIDGTVRTPGASYDAPPLGDLNTTRIGAILDSEEYAASLDEEDDDREQVCGSCRYRGGCNTYPIFATDDGSAEDGQCPVARPLMQAMDRHLDRLGFDDRLLESLFDGVMRAPAGADQAGGG